MASNKQPIVFRIKTQHGEDMDWTMSSPNTRFAEVMVSQYLLIVILIGCRPTSQALPTLATQYPQCVERLERLWL